MIEPIDNLCVTCNNEVNLASAHRIVNAGEEREPIWKRQHVDCAIEKRTQSETPVQERTKKILQFINRTNG